MTREVPAPPKASAVRIRFAIGDANRALYEGLARQFEQDNPDLRVELVSMEASFGQEETGDSWQALARASDAFAVTPLLEATEQGALYDLTPLLAADPQFAEQDIYSAAWARLRWRGGVWGIPLGLNTDLVFYDRDVLAASQGHDPALDWTLEDFSTLAASLTSDGDSNGKRYGFAPHTGAVNTQLVMRRAGLTGGEPVAGLDDPRIVEAVEWYRGLVQRGVIPDPVNGNRLVGRRDVIESKLAALWSGSLADYAALPSNSSTGITLLPCREPAVCQARWSVVGCAMSAYTSQPQATWRWLSFLTRQTPERLTGQAHLLPARRSIAQSAAFWQSMTAPLAAALQTSLNVTTAGEDVAYLRLEELYNAMLDILKDGVPVGERLAVANRAVQDRVRAGNPAHPAAMPNSAATSVADSESTRTRIVFAVDRPEERAFYRDLAESYELQQNKVHVDLVQPHFEPGSPDIGIPALAAQADCFVWYGESGEARYADSLLPLDPLVQRDATFDVKDFYPQWLEQFRLDGKQWAIPAAISPAVLRFNRRLFEAQGMAAPNANWTLQDFLSAVGRLTDTTSGQLGFVPNADWTRELIFFLTEQAGSLVDFGSTPPRARFDDPEMRQALRWYLELTRGSSTNSAFRITPQGLSDSTAFHNWSLLRTRLIQQGKVALWIDLPPYYGGKAIEAETLDAGIAPLPGGKGRTNIAAMTGYFIGRRTSNPEACWQWISFLSRQPTSIGNAPPRRSVADSLQYRNALGAERAAAYVSTIAGTGPMGLSYRGQEWLAPWFRWFLDACMQALADGDVDQHLELAQQRAGQYASCVADRSGFNEETAWQECVVKTDPSMPASRW